MPRIVGTYADIGAVEFSALLAIAPAGGQSLLAWPSYLTSYVLQGTTNLASPTWGFVMDGVPATAGWQTAMTVSNAPSAKFFRLMQVPTTTSEGMALIPQGSFTMGDTLDGLSDAIPTTVLLSPFYMDTNL